MSRFDPPILQIDRALRTLFAAAPTVRPLPGGDLPEMPMSEAERCHAAALLRVDHVGEVCAQALYAGQAATARSEPIGEAMRCAAREETEHLNWTAQRIAELGGRTSVLNPFWYLAAWTLGALAGRMGDAISLGFVNETERQVEAHLQGHLDRLPAADGRTRAILEQMKEDEIRHAERACQLGAQALPGAARAAMRLAARAMTVTAYRL